MAYRLLHYHGVSPENLALVGDGYSKPETVGLTESRGMLRRRAKGFAFAGSLLASALSFSVAGLLHASSTFNLSLVLLFVVPAAAALGACLGVFSAWLAHRFGELGRLSIYRHHLHQGHYLLMIEGTEKIVRLSQEVLGQYAAPRSQSR